MEKKKFLKGDFICRENSPGTEMFVILSGKVEVYKTINSEKIALNVLKPGDFCGEMSLLLNSDRTASLVVLAFRYTHAKTIPASTAVVVAN